MITGIKAIPFKPERSRYTPNIIGIIENARIWRNWPGLSPSFCFIASSVFNFSGDFCLSIEVKSPNHKTTIPIPIVINSNFILPVLISPRYFLGANLKLNIVFHDGFRNDFPAVVRHNLLDFFELIPLQNKLKRFTGW